MTIGYIRRMFEKFMESKVIPLAGDDFGFREYIRFYVTAFIKFLEIEEAEKKRRKMSSQK